MAPDVDDAGREQAAAAFHERHARPVVDGERAAAGSSKRDPAFAVRDRLERGAEYRADGRAGEDVVDDVGPAAIGKNRGDTRGARDLCRFKLRPHAARGNLPNRIARHRFQVFGDVVDMFNQFGLGIRKGVAIVKAVDVA